MINDIKVVLCCIAKNENPYIREWVEYYKNIGISKIFIYDNNDIDGERFEDVIEDYISNGYVEIIDIRGKEKGLVYVNGINLQLKCYFDCYNKKCKEYDWVCFFDVDEFLSFRNGYDLKSYLNQKRMKYSDTVLVGWEIYDDNNQMYYENKPVLERFTHKSALNYSCIKSIVRTNRTLLANKEDSNIHIIRVKESLPIRSNYKKYTNKSNFFTYKDVSNHDCYLKHIKTKSAEEFIKRHYHRHWGTEEHISANQLGIDDVKKAYFKYCEYTKEKSKKFDEISLIYIQKTLEIKSNNKIVTISNNINNNKSNGLKVAVCAIAKNENLYIREWVEWYKNLGISKIFLYDNNDIDGEHFEDVINDYIESGFVEIIDRRGVIKSVDTDKDGQTTQGLAYHDCYYNNYREYDWMCFFDIDEYLEIYSKYKSIYEFLNDFDKFDGVRVQWKMYGDNDNLYYENKPLFERFKYEANSSFDRHLKQILKCKAYDNDLIFCAHGTLNKELNIVNLKKQPTKNPYLDEIIYVDMDVYLNHFYSKSTQEFLIRKYNKTSAVSGINLSRNLNIEFLKNQYYEHNKQTDKKEKFIDMFINSTNSVNVYMASLYKDGYVIKSIKSIIRQPQVKNVILSANNYTNKQYNKVIKEVNSSKLIIHRTYNEKMSFEKLRYVNEDITTKYVAFCDDDLIFYNGYFIKMIAECEFLNSVVSYHGGILKKPLPINHYYSDRKSFSFNREVKENKEVDIVGNGVSLFKRDWITYKQWKDLYYNAPNVSMDDITVSYILRKNSKRLIVVKHSSGEIIERKDNKDTVYNIYKKNDSVQTDWVNKYFISL